MFEPRSALTCRPVERTVVQKTLAFHDALLRRGIDQQARQERRSRRSRGAAVCVIRRRYRMPVGQSGAVADGDLDEGMRDVRCRRAGAGDLTFLTAMLGEAAVWRPDKPTATGDEVFADRRYAMYLAGWPRPRDHGLIAEHDGPVGAAWFRTYTETNHGHGFDAGDVPELSIAVIASRRGEGIGRRLLVELVAASVDQGYRTLSLSVREQNPAAPPVRVGRLHHRRQGRDVLDHGPTRQLITLNLRTFGPRRGRQPGGTG